MAVKKNFNHSQKMFFKKKKVKNLNMNPAGHITTERGTSKIASKSYCWWKDWYYYYYYETVVCALWDKTNE